MFNNRLTKSGSAALIALILGTTAISPASAQYYPNRNRPVNNLSYGVIPSGTSIPVRYEKAGRILMAKNEVLPITLTVARNITDRNGNVIIPAGSEIKGQLKPTGNGVRFIAEELVMRGGDSMSINARSSLVTRTETIKKGANTQDILTGTAAGAGAAAIIAGFTGDRNINALEVLGGAALGTLAGWALPTTGVLGGGSSQLYSINPDRDLTLTLNSNFTVGRVDNNNYNDDYNNNRRNLPSNW
ncbi:MAG: hypothetical protein N5P05_003734 [Chroococcopsis gigantea SAG 12.99]|jgi:hypothetical protein|nr:hypothetical protein [Chroococcopsis gigantea SAG 12.99]